MLGQLPRLLHLQTAEHDVLDRGGQRRRFAPHGGHQQQPGCAGCTHQLLEQDQAVGVRPLQVVDEQQEPLALGQPREQLAQPGKRLPPQLLRVGRLGGHLHCRQDGNPLQDRKDLQERQGVTLARKQARDADRVLPDEVPRERIHDTVERLVGDVLPLVAATGEHQDRRLAQLERAGKVPHERALAHPRFAAHHHHLGCLRAGHQGVVEQPQLPRPPDERRFRRPGGRFRRVSWLGKPIVTRGDPRADLLAVQPLRRIADQQVHAQLIELRRSPFDQLCRARWQLALLSQQNIHQLAGERRLAGEHFIEDGAHSVPVGRRPHRLLRGLLGSHVKGRAHDPPLLGEPRGQGLGHQAEVQQHHPPVAGHQHVIRLDVAMDLARCVQRLQPVTQLQQNPPQPLRVQSLVPIPDVADHVAAVDQLHREEPLLAIAVQLAQAHQVRVLDVDQRTELVLERIERLAVQPLQQLERDIYPALQVARPVDQAHASLPHQRRELVAATQNAAGRLARRAGACSSRVRCHGPRVTAPGGLLKARNRTTPASLHVFEPRRPRGRSP